MPSSALVATLVASPERAELSDASVQRCAQELPGFTEIRWLDRGVAADVIFAANDDLKATRRRIEPAAAEAGADVFLQPLATRAKRLLLADMDSTLIGQECIDELAAEIGAGPQVHAITERAMRGELEFEDSLRERVALLADLPISVIEKILDERIELNPGAKTLFQTFRARGGYAAIVSGGFTPFTGEIARRIGADEHRANTLVVENGKLTGLASEPILGANAKLVALRELTARLGLTRAQTLAVGDGANDLAMLSEAGLGVAYYAKPKLAAAADARIEHADLTALLYAQGLVRADFVAG